MLLLHLSLGGRGRLLMETQCQSNVDSGQLKSAGGQRVGTAALLSWGLLGTATVLQCLLGSTLRRGI